MNLEELAAKLKAGDISVAEWEAGMRQYLREQYAVAMTLAKGGRENVGPADWGYMGSSLKKQYAFLNGFANDITNDPDKWLSGKLDYRMNLYKNSAYTTLADFQAREYQDQGYDEESNALGAADHCGGCLEETSKGWVPIGTLVPIGDRDCQVNCKCEMNYRKSTEMLFSPAQDNSMLFAPRDAG